MVSILPSQSSFVAQNIRNNILEISARIQSGRRVNTIADNPTNFTQSASFLARAGTLNTVLDGLTNSVQTINAARSVLNTLSNRLSDAQSLVDQSRLALINGTTDPNVANGEVPPTLNELITGDNPVAYYRLDTDLLNQGSATGVDGIDVNGVDLNGAALYSFGSGTSVQFNGTTQGIRIPDSNDINLQIEPQRTVELTFNADTVAGRQVLYEEGGGANGLTIYIDNGDFYVTGNDNGSFNYSFSREIVAGQTYHAAFVFDNVDTNSFTAYLNGSNIGSNVVSQDFAAHGGNIGIGYAPDTARYFDGAFNVRNFFQGRISDVAIYNDALTQADISARFESLEDSIPGFNSKYQDTIRNLGDLANDAYFKGRNILLGDDITTRLNETNTSRLTTDSLDISDETLDLKSGDFNNLNDVVQILFSIEEAQSLVDNYIQSLDTDLNVLTSRSEFTTETISTLQAGSDDLVGADVSADQALLDAQQSRLAIAEAAYSLSASFQNSLANDFLIGASSARNNSGFFTTLA